MGTFNELADKIEAALDKGRPGMAAIGGAKRENNLVFDIALQLDSIMAAMGGVILAIREIDPCLSATPAVPLPPPPQEVIRAMVEKAFRAGFGDGFSMADNTSRSAANAIDECWEHWAARELDGAVNAT
jgi:hypothetical protein